jgi:ubiquinone/menaquinone biosynthesis C-methylase UbiE
MSSKSSVQQLIAFVSKNGKFPEPSELGLENLVQTVVKEFGSVHLPMFVQMKFYIFNFYRFTVENLLASSMGDDHRVLDAGCGHGDSLRDYSKPKKGEVIGVDVSRTEVALSKRRWNGHASFVVADLSRLPFIEEAFDGAFSVDVLEHVDDKATVIRELARITRKGGFFVGSSSNNLNPLCFFDTTFGTLTKSVVDKFSNNDKAYDRHSRFSPSNLNSTLTKSGYLLNNFILTGTPVFDDKKMPMLAYIWILFDKVTRRKPLIYLKETMVWQATKSLNISRHIKL